MDAQYLVRSDLAFDRPEHLAATQPAEVRRVARDSGRLMVTTPSGHKHMRFHQLAEILVKGDLLVVNRSGTLSASLKAKASFGDIRLNLSTNYGGNLWVAEPRYSSSQPGPIPQIRAGETISLPGGEKGQFVRPYPGIPRLWFIQFDSDPLPLLTTIGEPIRYAYVNDIHPPNTYQTIFADTPGSAEMPSAAYPFTRQLVDKLTEKGIGIPSISLHTGVSSLELESDSVDQHVLFPEPFSVSESTAQLVNNAKAEGRRVIAVGTTVVRALESAWVDGSLQPMAGFSRLFVRPGRPINVIDGLLTGMHDPMTSHLALLYALAGKQMIDQAYAEAIAKEYRWHEFGDSHLILP